MHVFARSGGSRVSEAVGARAVHTEQNTARMY